MNVDTCCDSILDIRRNHESEGVRQWKVAQTGRQYATALRLMQSKILIFTLRFFSGEQTCVNVQRNDTLLVIHSGHPTNEVYHIL